MHGCGCPLWQEWQWYHRYQHIWAPLAYTLLSYSHRMEDFTFIMSKKWDSIRMAPVSFETMAGFWVGKLLFVMWQIVLPLYLNVSVQHMLLCHIVAEMVGSYYLAISFQVGGWTLALMILLVTCRMVDINTCSHKDLIEACATSVETCGCKTEAPRHAVVRLIFWCAHSQL